MMTAVGEADARHGPRHTTRQDEKRDRDSSLSDEYNSDEKKENDGGSASASSLLVDSISWQDRSMRDGDVSYYRTHAVSPIAARNRGVGVESPTTSFSSLEDQEIGPNLSVGSSTGNGLHHRHNNYQVHPSGSAEGGAAGSNVSQDKLLTTQMSPTRRRRLRPPGAKSQVENPFRKRKWTAVQGFRVLLLSGIGFYLLAMIRLMQQNSSNTENESEPSISRLSDIISLPFHQQYPMHPDTQGYLRSGSLSLPAMVAPLVDKVTRDDPVLMRRALEERVSERRSRTRPPLSRPQGYEIKEYDLFPLDHHFHEATRSSLRHSSTLPTTTTSALANITQICGSQARKASRENPDSFRQQDVLMDSGARVLITGILSNPLAFHLALTLKAQCGVDVLIGMDAMLPNTIRSRLQFVEQMKLLASNAPKMIQPILVPFLGLDPRVKKSKAKKDSSEHPQMLRITGELDLMNFQPTHIVHLASASFQGPRGSETAAKNPYAPKRPLSPYQISEGDPYEPSLFQIRSSMSGMEQLLSSVVGSAEDGENQPHVTYASSTTNTQRTSLARDTVVHTNTKLADEILADTYHSLFGIYSVGVRVPPNAVYGPWDHDGSEMYQALEKAIHGNSSAFDKYTEAQELIYVQDAVEAVLTAMQYRAEKATNFDMTANAAAPLSEVASTALALSSGTQTRNTPPGIELSATPSRTSQQLQWKSRTSLHEGLLRTVAWHIDRARPYGPPGGWDKQLSTDTPAPVTGDDLLLKHSIPTCAADDLACHAGPSYLPCASECSTKAQCAASIFDPVRELARNMTEGCDALLYTQSLGWDIEDLKLQAQFEDDVEPAICNLAFVAESSPLVKAVIEKIPAEELVRLGVPSAADFDVQLKKLNGRLLYRGWILIWVDPIEPISPADTSLLKLSPSLLFSRDVLYAVFVEENFTVSPTPDDVRFLISQMDRGATRQRGVWRTIKNAETSKTKKVKFTIPAEPEKRAAMLVSQLKFKISDRSRISQDTKISVFHAVRFMRFEIGLDPTKQKESSAVKLQRDFYKRIPTFVNGKDLRDGFEPMYKYELKHWVRTRWVVHDLTLEESRDIRCNWYQEHVQWGSEIDQLSLAAAMAQKEIERRIAHGESDDRSTPKTPVLPELRDVTDNNEWFAMETEQNKQHLLQSERSAGVEEVNEDDAKEEMEEEGGEDDPEGAADPTLSPEKKKDAGLYVRIISDRIMSLSRKAYARYRLELAQQAGGATR